MSGAPKWINDRQHDRDIAGYVISGDAFVERVTKAAEAVLRELTAHEYQTFAAAVESQNRDVLRKAVKAIYLQLKELELSYAHEPAFDPFSLEQTIRLPAEVGGRRRGTCIDLVLLFLSCLANAQLPPVYAQVRTGQTGHAFAAVWLREPPPNRDELLTPERLLDEKSILLVECTGFVEGASWRQHAALFEDACAEARARLHGPGAGQLEFALDVWRAWEKGVRPYEPRAGQATTDFRADVSRIDRYAPERLIGREDELGVLTEAWGKVRRAESPRANVITFVALGGEGKTSLVAKWAATLAADNWPGCDAAYAWSFYSQGTREQTAASSDAFLAAALTFFGDAATANSALHPLEKAKKLAELVGRRRALLILDGLEPLQYPPTSPLAGQLKDQGMSALLKGLAARNAGLCVVTTRYSVTDLKNHRQSTAPETKLLRLSPTAGVELLRSLGVRGRPAEFEQLVHDVNGHALTLNLIGKFLHDAHAGDIRRRDLVRLEDAEEEQGGHAFRVLDAYVRWFESEGDRGRRAIALLRLLGLFDRPAAADCLAALKQPPAIAGLTEVLAGMTEAQRNIALTRLEEARLLTVNRDAAGTLLSLDAHPLLRDYFARQLRIQQPDAYRAAHRRLYEHLCATTKDKPEPDLDDLQPLYQAVAHGCQAGLPQEACSKVYRDRINRGNEHYSSKKLGAVGTNLGAVACFFEALWSRPSPLLTEAAQGWLLNEAALNLRALGRLTEALEPMRAVLQMDVKQEDWEGAAISAGNLSELELSLGEVAAAVRDAEQSVGHADRSGDAFRRMASRPTLADALHQAGRRAEAEARFREAEEMQVQLRRKYPLLYSVPGFQYCDLLLAASERAAWQSALHKPDAQARGGSRPVTALAVDPLLALRACAEVEQRATQTLQWAKDNNLSLLTIALDHLTLCRVALYGWVLERTVPGLSPQGFRAGDVAVSREKVRTHLTAAVNGLHCAGIQDQIPRALLTRAWFFAVEATAHRHVGEQEQAAECERRAQADLDDAWEIAERGPMPLFLADIHLHRARLFHAATPYPWAADAGGKRRGPRDDLAAARKLIQKCGYGRRKEELEDAEAAAGHWRD